MLSFRVTFLSQLRIAPTVSLYRVAKLLAPVRIESNAFGFPVSSQSMRSAGCNMNPISCVFVLRAMGWRGSAQARQSSRSWAWKFASLDFGEGREIGYFIDRSNIAYRLPGKNPHVQNNSGFKVYFPAVSPLAVTYSG